jgi:hypothetical protein
MSGTTTIAADQARELGPEGLAKLAGELVGSDVEDQVGSG